MAKPTQMGRPNIVYFFVDNLGMGELSSYIGGPLRGTSTTPIDRFASEASCSLTLHRSRNSRSGYFKQRSSPR
jgi:hypothetical protein